MEAPRDDLVRSMPFVLERHDDDDGLTLTGHAAVFNEWTEIHGWEGHFKERVAPGAFKRTLNNNRGKIRLQFDHGQHPLIGSIPIGKIGALREDDVGLFVEAKLTDNWLIQPVRDAIREGAVDGMSFRFSVVQEDWTKLDSDLPERTISEVKLMELGPVVWPAYSGTDVGVRFEAVRSMLMVDEPLLRKIAHLVDTETRSDTSPASDEDAGEPVSEGDPPSDRQAPASDGGTANDAPEHSPAEYQPTRRPSIPVSRLREQAAEIRQIAEAAQAKEL